MKRLPLTRKERAVWGYILGYIEDNDYSPTLSEIATRLGSKNHQAASDYISRLESKGYIKRKRGKWRNISIIIKK
mgnify:CR=1 FL=1